MVDINNDEKRDVCMTFDAEALLQQKLRDEEQEKKRMARYREMDRPIDNKLYRVGVIYLYVSVFIKYFILAVAWAQQKAPPLYWKIHTIQHRNATVTLAIAALILAVGLLWRARRKAKTWAECRQIKRYIPGVIVYAIGLCIFCVIPPVDLIEQPAVLLFCLLSTVVDLLLAGGCMIHTYCLFRKKYLPDYQIIPIEATTFGMRIMAFLIVVIMIAVALFSDTFQTEIAPLIPKFLY